MASRVQGFNGFMGVGSLALRDLAAGLRVEGLGSQEIRTSTGACCAHVSSVFLVVEPCKIISLI